MKNLELNKQGWQTASVVLRRWLQQVPQWILVTYIRWIKLVVIIAGFMVALYVVMRLLYFLPSEDMAPGRSAVKLQSGTIDELEVWLEERQNEREDGIIAGQQAYFITP